MVLALRAHPANPWVIERLRLLGGYYDPVPEIIVVDLGSPEPQRSELRSISEEHGFRYVYEDDTDTFSLSKARNIGAAHATTDLLLFCDIDCFGERDLCARLVRYANTLDLGAIYDQIVRMPVYHLSASETDRFQQESDPERRSTELGRAFAHGVYTGYENIVDFVDYMSNIFLCHRAFYDLIGGYNEHFRGHGSEDYEFLLRYALWSGQFPLPVDPDADVHGPLTGSYFLTVPYRGFRRLGELVSFHTEVAGLRIVHLHHASAGLGDSWTRKRDFTRSRFNEQARPFLEDPRRLLAYDWMPRGKKALALIEHAEQIELFGIVRRSGYRLVPCIPEELANTDLPALLQAEEIDTIVACIADDELQPATRDALETAKEHGLQTLVIRRGVFPESWLIDEAEPGTELSCSAAELQSAALTDLERGCIEQILRRLRAGELTLEASAVLDALVNHTPAQSTDPGAQDISTSRASDAPSTGEASIDALRHAACLLLRRHHFVHESAARDAQATGKPLHAYHLGDPVNESHLRAAVELPFSEESYAGARLRIHLEPQAQTRPSLWTKTKIAVGKKQRRAWARRARRIGKSMFGIVKARRD